MRDAARPCCTDVDCPQADFPHDPHPPGTPGQPRSGRTRTQRAILQSEWFWGITPEPRWEP